MEELAVSMDYIRRTYDVPAKRGSKIVFTKTDGAKVNMEIIGSKGAYLICRFMDGFMAGKKTALHPTWNIKYI